MNPYLLEFLWNFELNCEVQRYCNENLLFFIVTECSDPVGI